MTKEKQIKQIVTEKYETKKWMIRKSPLTEKSS